MVFRVGIAIWSANYPGNLAPVRAGVVSILGTPNRGTGARWALVDILRTGNGAPVTALSWSSCGRYPLLWSFAFHLLLFFPLLFLILEMQHYELDRRLCYIWLGCFSFMLEAMNVLSDFIMGELKNVLHGIETCFLSWAWLHISWIRRGDISISMILPWPYYTMLASGSKHDASFTIWDVAQGKITLVACLSCSFWSINRTVNSQCSHFSFFAQRTNGDV